MIRRKRGDVEWVKLDAFCPGKGLEGIEVGIKHVGPGQAREWSYRIEGLRLAEMARIFELRRQFTAEERPELHTRDEKGGFVFQTVTVDGMRESLDLSVGVLADCLAGVRGIPELETCTDAAVLAEEMRYLDVAEALLAPALKQQALRAEQIFTQGPGDLGAAGLPEAGHGPDARPGARSASGGGRAEP